MSSHAVKILSRTVAAAVLASALGLAPPANAETEAQAQARKKSATRAPVTCSQPVYFYQLNPAGRGQADAVTKCFKAANKLAEATAVYRKIAERRGGPPEAWKYLAEVLDAQGKFSEAEGAYLKYFERRPRDIEARMNAGRLYSGEKAFDKSIEQYRLVLKLRPNYSPALAGMARVLAFQGKNQESLQYYDRAIALSPRDSEAASGKAFALLWMGRPEEAHALFTQLAQKFPKDTTIANGLQQSAAAVEEKKLAEARRSGNTAQLEAYHRSRLAQNPNDLGTLRALAELSPLPQRCDEAISFRRKAQELSRTDPSLEVELASTLSACNRFEEAIGRYRRVVQLQPKNDSVLYDLGATLRRAGRLSEAIEVFRAALRVNSRNPDSRLGLALALSVAGQHQEALVRFDEVLAASPQNYEALQGKAYVLFWTSQYVQARGIFQALQARQPDDKQNTEALKQIVQAEEDARWAALRPRPEAPPADWLAYYQKRLGAYPNDLNAIKGVASIQAQLRNNNAAIEAYRRVLQTYPDDRESKSELARLLSWEGQIQASIQLYEELHKAQPDDIETLENLARVYMWSSRPQDALKTYQLLLARQPSNTSYQLEMARLQLRLKDTPAAREFLTAILSADPKNREATLLLAQMNLNQGNLENSIQQFDLVLKNNPNDPDALFGKARAYYYHGELEQAYEVTSRLVKEQPKNVDALFLLAALERSRRNRTTALALLNEAINLSPQHTEAVTMRRSILEAGTVTLQTTVAYAREIGKGLLIGDDRVLDQDLRTFTYGTTLGFAVIPRTDSYLSVTFLPSNTPVGFLRGAVGPSTFFYRQVTQLTPRLGLRAGAGLVRFGPGEPVVYPGQPVLLPSAQLSPLVMAGLNFAPHKKVKWDFSFSRSGITYTPVSTHLGVVENRVGTGVSVNLTPRTQLYADYYYGRFTTREYDHITVVGNQRIVDRRQDHDRIHHGSLFLNRNVYRSEHVSFDAGYSVRAFGHPGPGIFLGFFNPGFTQTHLFNSRLFGKIGGPFGYDFSSGIGVQQTDEEPWRRGLQLSPAIIVRVSPRMSFTVGYTYYNTAHTLSTLNGNAVYLTTDWRF